LAAGDHVAFFDDRVGKPISLGGKLKSVHDNGDLEVEVKLMSVVLPPEAFEGNAAKIYSGDRVRVKAQLEAVRARMIEQEVPWDNDMDFVAGKGVTVKHVRSLISVKLTESRRLCRDDVYSVPSKSNRSFRTLIKDYQSDLRTFKGLSFLKGSTHEFDSDGG
jgi:hypothetical protein